MKQTVLAIILAFATAHHAMAQDQESRGGMQRGPHGNPEERLERMREGLGLSDEQVSQIREIQQSDMSRREKREQMQAVLTEDQLNLMREHRAQHGGKRGMRHQGESSEQYN